MFTQNYILVADFNKFKQLLANLFYYLQIFFQCPVLLLNKIGFLEIYLQL